MNVTPCPIKTLSSISAPSQTNEWLEILQHRPTRAFFWISTKAPIFVSSPISHPYRLMNFESFTSLPNFTVGATQAYSFTDSPPSHGCVPNDRRLPGSGLHEGPLLRH